MKVLMVYRGYSIMKGGGLERRFIRIFNYLVEKINIQFITRKCLVRDYKILNLTDKKIKTINANNLLEELFLFSKEIKREMPDIVHFLDFGLFNFALSLITKTLNPKLKIIVSLCDTQIIYKDSFRNLFLRKYFMLIADKIDSLYPSISREERNKKIKVAPCSIVDTQKFKPTKKEKIICFCGRLEESKNPMLFLNSIKKIADFLTKERWQVFIIGGGSLEKTVKEFIEKNKISGLVSHLTRGDMSQIAGKSSIFVSLQEKENYPSQSLLEAMSSENAIIATNVGDTNLLVRDNINGLLVNKSPKEISSVIKLMILSQSYKYLGENSRKIAQKHSVKRYCSHLLKIYEGTMEKH